MVLEEFPETASRLIKNAQIVLNQHSETGEVKTIDGQHMQITVNEQNATRSLRKTCVKEVEPAAELSLAQGALKRRRLSASKKASYLDLRFTLPTSNVCVRLFSKAGHVLGDRRKRLIPANFEQQMFLNANSDLRSVKDINNLATSAESE